MDAAGTRHRDAVQEAPLQTVWIRKRMIVGRFLAVVDPPVSGLMY